LVLNKYHDSDFLTEIRFKTKKFLINNPCASEWTVSDHDMYTWMNLDNSSTHRMALKWSCWWDSALVNITTHAFLQRARIITITSFLLATQQRFE